MVLCRTAPQLQVAASQINRLPCGNQQSLRGARLPHYHAHAKQKVREISIVLPAVAAKEFPHLLRNIGSAYRGHSVDARDVAPHQGKARIDQRQMQRMADQIVDQHRASADAQCLGGEAASRSAGSR